MTAPAQGQATVIDRAGLSSNAAHPGGDRLIVARRVLRRLVRSPLLWAVLTGGLAIYAAVFAIWAVAPLDISAETRALLGDAAFLPPGILVAMLAWRASGSRGLSPQARRAWICLGLAYLAFWLGDALYFVYDIVANEVPYPSLADAAYLAYYPLLLLGLASFPRVMRSSTEKLRFVLDAATVAVGGAMVVWYFVLGPIASEVVTDPLTTILSIAYPVGDLVLLLGFAIIAIRAPREMPRRALVLLLVGLLVSLAADLGYAVQSLDGTYESGRWVDTLYIGAWALLGASAHFTYSRSHARTEPVPNVTSAPDGLPLVPYLAVALGYGMLLVAVRTSWNPTVGGLVVGAGALTALVVARQVAAVRENARLIAERESRRGEARFRSLVQNASDVIVVVDGDSLIRYETPSVEPVLGYRLDELHGTRLAALVHPDDAGRHEALLADAIGGAGGSASAELRLARSDGSWLFVEVTATNLLRDADIQGIVVTIRNIDDRKRVEVKLAHQAFHDALTGLANRLLFSEQVGRALATAQRGRGPVVVLFLDLDNFKTVNDSLGHDAGDQVLLEVGRRVRASTHAADLASRFGGDEFAVLLQVPGSAAAAVAVSERILGALREPFALDGVEVALGASIGIAVSPAGVEQSDELLRNADVAMYAAKTAGKGRYAIFEPGMQGPARKRLDLEAALRHALDQGEFELHFQPIVALATRQIVGAEGLLRWRRPDNGSVAPAEFIPIAEETGLIVPIGRWALEQGCRAAASWTGTADRPPFVAVNLSARQLQHHELVDEVAEILARTGLAPERLVLEVTESMVMEDPEKTIRRLHALKALGVRLAIDDFGTGYSSLSYLRTLPVDEVKIDRSFIADLDRAAGSALVQGIVELGHSLGLEIVAEGIEQPGQADALERFGCELAQGFHFARPMPRAGMDALLRPAAGSIPTAA